MLMAKDRRIRKRSVEDSNTIDDYKCICNNTKLSDQYCAMCIEMKKLKLELECITDNIKHDINKMSNNL